MLRAAVWDDDCLTPRRCGLVERRRYQDRPPRDEYYLTMRGHDLLPVLRELIKWGQQHIPGVAQKPPASFTGVAPRPKR